MFLCDGYTFQSIKNDQIKNFEFEVAFTRENPFVNPANQMLRVLLGLDFGLPHDPFGESSDQLELKILFY